MKNIYRFILVSAIVLAIAFCYRSGWLEFLTFDHLKNEQADLKLRTEAHFFEAVAGFFTLYVVVTALSIPGAAVMSLAGGAIFGLFWGTLIISFASTLGATLCFIGSRFLFRGFVEKRFVQAYERIDRGLKSEGVFYLFSLRLIPAIPFFLINLVFGLTRMKTTTFFIVSQIGMLPGTIAYVNAGTRLGEINNLSEVMRPDVIMSFLILAILPWIGKAILRVLALVRT